MYIYICCNRPAIVYTLSIPWASMGATGLHGKNARHWPQRAVQAKAGTGRQHRHAAVRAVWPGHRAGEAALRPRLRLRSRLHLPLRRLYDRVVLRQLRWRVEYPCGGPAGRDAVQRPYWLCAAASPSRHRLCCATEHSMLWRNSIHSTACCRATRLLAAARSPAPCVQWGGVRKGRMWRRARGVDRRRGPWL